MKIWNTSQELIEWLEHHHSPMHEYGGVDEINVADLSGELADLQKVKDHTHQSAGSGVGGQLDHGLALTGLTDDDHTIYAKGPASATDHAIARFDGTTGKLIQDYTSNAPTIGDTGVIIFPTDVNFSGGVTEWYSTANARFRDDRRLGFGTTDDFTLLYENADTDARILLLAANPGADAGDNAAIILLCDNGAINQDLGLFNSFADDDEHRYWAVLDKDRDSYVMLGFAADDDAQIVIGGSAILTLPAHTWGGTVLAGGQTLNNLGNITMNNNTVLLFKDSGGTPRNVFSFDASNAAYFDNDAASAMVFRTDNASGVGNLVTRLQITGNVATSSATFTYCNAVISTGSVLILGDDIHLRIGSAPGGDYRIYYDSGNTRWVLWSTDIDGSATDGTVILIEDGTNDVLFQGEIDVAETIKVATTQVVGAQGAAVADATDADTTMARLNDLLARCRAHGLIAT